MNCLDITTKDCDPEILKYGVPARHFSFRRDKKKSPSCLKIFVFKDKRLDPGYFFLTTIKKSDGIGYENQALRMKFFDVKEFFFHDFYAFSFKFHPHLRALVLSMTRNTLRVKKF